MATPEILEKIKRQVEFYFCDANVTKDKFLKNQIGSHPDGYVALSVLLTFKKVEALTKDSKDIAAAVADSAHLQLDEEKVMVKRKTPIPESYDPIPLSIYVKGIPIEAELDAIRDHFFQYGDVAMVQRRYCAPKDGKRVAKPSCHIVFTSEEEAKKALAADIKWEGTPLVEKMTRAEHDELQKERSKKNKEAKEDKKEGAKAEFEAAKAVKMAQVDAEHEKMAGLHLTGLGEGADWKAVKDAFAEKGVEKGQIKRVTVEGTEADVLFADEELAKKYMEEGKGMKINDSEVAYKLMDGEPLQKAIQASKESVLAAIESGKGAGGRGGRGGRGRGGRGGRGGGRGQKRGRGGEGGGEPPAKKAKTE